MHFEWRTEGRTLLLLTAAFLAALWVPFDAPRFEGALHEAFALLQWYAREHVVSCLLPALLIAGAIAVFVSQGSVIRLLGAGANKLVAYGVASVSGTILAVCSCTVLPLFGGLYKRGAGLGPGRCVPLLRSGDQHPRHRADGKGARLRTGRGAGDRRRRVFGDHRPRDGGALSPRGGARNDVHSPGRWWCRRIASVLRGPVSSLCSR